MSTRSQADYHVVYNANTTEKIAEKIDCYLYGSEDAPTAVSSNEYDYGEYAIAIGNPDDAGISVTKGVGGVRK